MRSQNCLIFKLFVSKHVTDANIDSEKHRWKIAMTLMIALVGGQSLPNLLPARHSHPDAVLFVYSKFTKPVYEKLTGVLQQETKVYGLETDAYNILMIEQALHQELNTAILAPHTLEFNLTGGTKAMSLAAYRVAAQR